MSESPSCAEGGTIPLQFIVEHCLGKEGAYLDNPFGEVPICAKWKGHIFAEIYPLTGDRKITLRCDPGDGERYDALYPSVVMPAYHVPLRQKPYKRTIRLDGGGISAVELAEMIDRSYEDLVRRYGS